MILTTSGVSSKRYVEKILEGLYDSYGVVPTQPRRGRCEMLWMIVVILLVLWLLGFFAFPAAGSLIHLLLVIAVIVIIWQLVSGRRAM